MDPVNLHHLWCATGSGDGHPGCDITTLSVSQVNMERVLSGSEVPGLDLRHPSHLTPHISLYPWFNASSFLLLPAVGATDNGSCVLPHADVQNSSGAAVHRLSFDQDP